jgi:hypothetical protein
MTSTLLQPSCLAIDEAVLAPSALMITLGDALNAGYLYLEVRCLGCDTHQTVTLDVVLCVPKTSSELMT